MNVNLSARTEYVAKIGVWAIVVVIEMRNVVVWKETRPSETVTPVHRYIDGLGSAGYPRLFLFMQCPSTYNRRQEWRPAEFYLKRRSLIFVAGLGRMCPTTNRTVWRNKRETPIQLIFSIICGPRPTMSDQNKWSIWRNPCTYIFAYFYIQ